ncbi:hypothetical protein [Helicobacter mustelae]|nr:hypothetical protein [Helicobacter mustelae]SQH71399.1 Uncharacterised protein [Helicobacter mustelae]
MMKKILLCLGLFAFVVAQDAQALSDANDQGQGVKTGEKKRFYPAEVQGHSYGVFSVGYAYQYQSAGQITNTHTGNTIRYKGSFNNVYFSIERGWIGGKNNMFMLGGYLDGVAGQTFFISVGVKGGLRLLNGWVIPHFAVGYQLEHLQFPKDIRRYNMQGAVFSIGTFVNVTKGFGIDFTLRAGTPFHMLNRNHAKTYGNKGINNVGIMLSFTFYDFSI